MSVFHLLYFPLKCAMLFTENIEFWWDQEQGTKIIVCWSYLSASLQKCMKFCGELTWFPLFLFESFCTAQEDYLLYYLGVSLQEKKDVVEVL